MLFVELPAQLVTADAGGDGKRAEIVGAARIGRGDVIGQGAEVGLARTRPLLAERVEFWILDFGFWIGVAEHDIVALRIRRPESVYAIRSQQLLANDAIQ